VVAFQHLAQPEHERLQAGEVRLGRAHADDRRDREPELLRIEIGAISADDPRVLEPPDPLGRRRRREPNSPSELAERKARVGL
jgi:hypothetical protein